MKVTSVILLILGGAEALLIGAGRAHVTRASVPAMSSPQTPTPQTPTVPVMVAPLSKTIRIAIEVDGKIHELVAQEGMTAAQAAHDFVTNTLQLDTADSNTADSLVEDLQRAICLRAARCAQ